MSQLVVQSGDEVEAALVEVTKVKETAERVANGDSSADADQIRVVAGLVHQLAEQTERLFATMRAPVTEGQTVEEEHDAELAREEDRTPQCARLSARRPIPMR
jgi:hypothetical protein